jgi:hypothetical protein
MLYRVVAIAICAGACGNVISPSTDGAILPPADGAILPPADGDISCRLDGTGWVTVAFDWQVLPCVYQGPDRQVHAKVNARGGSTDVRLFTEIGIKRGSDPVQWDDSTLSDSQTDNGDHAGFLASPTLDGNTVVAYSSPSSGLAPESNAQYFAKSYLSESGHLYGDVEAGPITP